ncbi:ABC transporter substrate-binding protein [Sporosarcina pasteurii]|uniref:Vitamin B12-binding protein n=1 Tax=Sporosarcina pasteurii TaxID=1474 RepID=A0A380BCJ7_SPOPA|nr:ABC transporter substrate-binding protein [Sporosarcina pasteurii]MDS9472319.1 helical backbone metal receptor [Sporosarcina pasteurii]QBQ06298.1 ABC transporter substrate-binding protein [Sporosarcina pasteurii]SUI99046.1 Vitamin B12-binding protein precursor [Sporosarcina pasteurii]
MKKIWKLWLLSIVAVFLLAACGGNATEEKPKVDETETSQEENKDAGAEEAYPITLTDAVGNEITLEKAPEKIVSMMPSNTEILFALDLADEIVGVSDFDDYPAEAAEKERIGGQEFNVEAIIALDPDIVFGHESAFGLSEEGYQQISDAGIPVFVVKNAADFDETYKTIETIGLLTDKQEEAEQIISTMKEKVEEVLTKLENVEEEKTVFVETSPAPEIYTPGQNTFMQEMLDMVGAKNIADDQEGWFVMEPEELVDRNPDVIIVMYDYIDTAVEDVYARDGFDTITAIKEEQVIQVDENITSRTGPRLAEGLEAIAKAIYPEVFSE